MRASVITAFGGPEVLVESEVPIPAPGPGQILVRVRAAGVNPAELIARSGGFGLPAPAVIGFEFAGEVVSIGPDVEGVREGDRVAGWPDGFGEGSYAEYTVSGNYAKIPDGVSYEDAAATVIGADNAARGLALLGLRAGETLIVTGASGALGGAAVQFARGAGVSVIGTAGRSSLDYVESLGAVAIEHGEGVEGRLRAAAPGGVDAALDTAGKGLLPALIAVRGGTDRIVTLADAEARRYGIPFSGGHPGNRNNRYVRDALEQIAAGTWRTRIGRAFPLSEAAEAHRFLEQGHTGGKVLLLP